MEEYKISKVHSKLGTLERGNIFSFNTHAYTKQNIEKTFQEEK